MLVLGLGAAVRGTAQDSVPAPAQETARNSGASLQSVIGEVTATSPAAKQIELKMDAGGSITVILQENTVYLRVPPGETDLKKAVKITPADIGVGDRVYARGRLAEDPKSIPALAVIVMTKADLAQTRERERADWQKRAVAGTLSGLNPETKEISLSVRSSAGSRTLIVEPSPKTIFHRYAPDSVRFVQAKPSSFAELKVGDALRILGEKNSDGTRIKAEKIVSGSFRNIAGTVNAIDAAAGEIRMTDLGTRRPLSVKIASDTMLRRMPATKPATPANRPQEGGSSPASGGRPSEGPTKDGARPAAATARPQQEGGSKPASGGRPSGGSTQCATGGGGLTDPERMPVLSLRELKRDEIIIVLCTVGTEPSRVTAIVVVAGVESLLGPVLRDQTQVVGPWNFFDISVP
ncbi:MAG: hypothetical protein HYS05_00025 [Acidobacteria bacterium]|nr:hypothetical protein [Acidobacteriota bacterium]